LKKIIRWNKIYIHLLLRNLLTSVALLFRVIQMDEYKLICDDFIAVLI
jgi:hypothetical protein